MALALCLTLLPTAALAAEAEGTEHKHPICGTTCTDGESHPDVTWEAINNETDLTNAQADGHYYLTQNVELSGTWTPKNNITLDLNGKTITANVGFAAINVIGVTFTLCDCKGTGKITHERGKTGSGVYMSGGEFHMYGGSITGNTANVGGGVYMYGGQFTMYGGSITNNTAEKGSDNNDGNGGGVYVNGGGTFTMTGGEISGGNKAKYGGGVYVKNGGTFNMNDGAISENTANQGGGVSVSTDGTFTMSGGTISGNTTDSTDGGVCVANGQFTMSGGKITGNTAISYSGGVGVHNSATFIMSGGTIGGTTDGEANKANYGGGVNVDQYGKFEMSGGEISGNKANQNGGGVYVDGGTFEMSGDASIIKNTATTNGGGVGVYSRGTFNMKGGTIGGGEDDANTADQDGGGVYASSGTFTMSGGRITGNHNNGVFVHENATFTVSDAPTVTGNTRNSAASNVYLAGYKRTITIGKAGLNGSAESIGVTIPYPEENSVIATNAKGDYSGIFFIDDKQYVVKHDTAHNNLVLAKPQSSTHKHVWAYTNVDKSTVSVTCKGASGSCDYTTTPATVTIRMAQPTYTYSKNMETPTAQLTHSDNWPEDVARAKEADIKYFKSTDGGNSYGTSVTHPDGVKAVGMYLARLSFNGKYIEAHFSVVDNSKQNPTYTAPTAKKDLVYTGENQPLIDPGSTNHGRMWYKLGTDDIYSTLIPMAKDAGSYTVYYKVEGDATHNDVAEQSIEVTIAKAQLSGTPTFTKVTEAGKTLKNVTLMKPKDWPEGTFEWGTGATETSKDTQILQGQEYWWYYRSANHSATGKIVPWANPSSGDGSGSGSSSGSSGSYDSNPIIKTETKNNPDGSTTKTETRKDGSVTATTTGKNGSTSKTETKKDGSSVTENKAADGSTGTVKTDKNGQIEAKTALSNKAIEAAKKNGEAVKAPLEVEASRNSNTAPTVKVELPKNAGETEVEIPVSNAKPGTVAVLVHPDGTEEILKNSVPTEGGIRLTVDGSATVKIVDNSKGFIDIRNHWAEDEIDFVSARGLVNGVSDTIYAPNNSTTRAQLWTILARQNDANLNGGNTWYEKAQNWAKSEGVSDGTDPNADINRAQMVTMLWRAVGQPAAGRTASFIDVPADAYYAGAVSWAVENGITVGVSGGRFDPNGTCTRAQVAAFLARHMK